MELENGCFYKQRNGVIVGPVVKICDVNWDFWIPTSYFRPYRKDGKATLSGFGERDSDLIEKVYPVKHHHA